MTQASHHTVSTLNEMNVMVVRRTIDARALPPNNKQLNYHRNRCWMIARWVMMGITVAHFIHAEYNLFILITDLKHLNFPFTKFYAFVLCPPSIECAHHFYLVISFSFFFFWFTLSRSSFSPRRNIVVTRVHLLSFVVPCLGNNMQETEHQPEFLAPLDNFTVTQGRDISFTCVVNDLGPYRVSGFLLNHYKYLLHTRDKHNLVRNFIFFFRIIFFYTKLNRAIHGLVLRKIANENKKERKRKKQTFSSTKNLISAFKVERIVENYCHLVGKYKIKK